MKKILLITLASVLALASCAKFEHDSEPQTLKTGAPVISEVTFGTDSLTAKIAPADKNATYYSYALIEGPKDSTIDAAALLSNKLKAAIASNCLNASEFPEMSIKVNDLDAGETYTLYAVASSATGTLSEVSTHVFILDDKDAPSFDEDDVEYELSAKDSSVLVSIPFNRDIKFGENAKITVSEWAPLDFYNMELVGGIIPIIKTPIWSFDLTAEKKEISIDGNVLTFAVPDTVYFPGKVLTFSYAAGTFISLPVSEGAKADVPCAELKPATIVYGVGAYPGTGPAYTYPTITFEIEEAEGNPSFVIAELWKDARFNFVSERPIFGGKEVLGSIYYNLNDPKCTSERKSPVGEDNVIDLKPGDDTLKVKLSVAPVKGEMIHFELEEGALYDIFGNTSKAFSTDSIGVGALELTFDAFKVGCNNFDCAVTPGIEGVYFVLDYTDDLSKDDAALIKDTKDYIQYWADTDGVTFEKEYLEYFAIEGKDTLSTTNLDAESKYIAFGFYMQPDGTVLSGVFRKEITTAEFEFPTETTGTFTYNTSPFSGSESGVPVSINATKDTITIKGVYQGVDLKLVVDKSGNITIPQQVVAVHSTYGNIYVEEIYSYAGSYPVTSYYNSLDKTIYLVPIYYDAEGPWGYSKFKDTFCFDNSQPAPAPSAVSNVASVKSVSVSKINAPRRRHVR